MVFVALLRAINVTGQNRVPMAGLRKLFEGLGLRDVRTHLQSGNVVFEADDAPAGELAAAIEVRIERDLGPRVGVLVMSSAALREVAGANPFTGDPHMDEQWLHATFLFGASGDSDFGPASEAAYSAVYQAAFGALTLPADEGEDAAFVGVPTLAVPVIYLRLSHGYGRTKLNNAYFERQLGAAATTRSWRTVRALAEMSARED